ncbi:MAG: BrnT family toxin [Gammaproteobacteria bacterium]|nr:MAG: BrnT family toxin [Gammaproteobacteria bacterium]
MNDGQFSWDKHKEKANIKKHQITFDEAKTVFLDENARLIYDPDHSESEDRFIMLGMSSGAKILIVVHCVKNYQNIRLISARVANKVEKQQYTEHLL